MPLVTNKPFIPGVTYASSCVSVYSGMPEYYGNIPEEEKHTSTRMEAEIKPQKTKKRLYMSVRGWLWTVFLACVMAEVVVWLPTLFKWMFTHLPK